MDLRDSCEHAEKTVSYTEALDLQQKLSIARYFECSALHRTNLKEIFEEVCKIVLEPPQEKKQNKKCTLL
jgi:GTPase SAR1 family protein